MPSPIILFFTPVFLTVVYLCHCLRSPLAKIPGPKHSLFTSWVLKYHEWIANRTAYIHSLHQTYGPVVRIAPNEVAFASVEGVKEIYMSGGSGYDKTEFYQLFTQYDTRTMFSTLDKEHHSKRKRLIADRYANTNIMKPDSLQGIQERADHFIQKCKNAGGKSVDLYIELHNYAFDCVTHHLFHPYSTEALRNAEDENIMREVTFDSSLKFRLITYYTPSIARYLRRAISLFTPPRSVPLANNLVLDACAKPDHSPFTLMSRLKTYSQTAASEKDAEKSTGPETLRLLDMAAECMDHMAAGIETTGDALCWLLHHLSLPEAKAVQAQLATEVRDAAQASDAVAFDKLPYLDAVVKEGLRLWPSIPMSLPRYVPRGGRVIDGAYVPAGVIVSAQPYSLHRLGWPDPEAFRPERWLEPEGRQEKDRRFFAFAAGGRGCTGRHLALAEMKMLLVAIYSRFETRVSPAMTASMAMADQIISSRPEGQECLVEFVPLEKEL